METRSKVHSDICTTVTVLSAIIFTCVLSHHLMFLSSYKIPVTAGLMGLIDALLSTFQRYITLKKPIFRTHTIKMTENEEILQDF